MHTVPGPPAGPPGLVYFFLVGCSSTCISRGVFAPLASEKCIIHSIAAALRHHVRSLLVLPSLLPLGSAVGCVDSVCRWTRLAVGSNFA